MRPHRIKNNLGYLIAGLVVFSIATTVYIEFKYYPDVKKSSFGVCHTPESPYYSQTRNYDSYGSLEGCLSSGGRTPFEDYHIGECEWRHTWTQ